MQFPTCKTPVIKDGVLVSSLIEELVISKFTGYCKILTEENEHFLAFKEGEYILAESGNQKGADALKAIINLGHFKAKAFLCSLSSKQFQVTLLFNTQFRILSTGEFESEAMSDIKSISSSIVPATELIPPIGKNITPITRIQQVSIPSTAGKTKRVRSIKITAEVEDENEKKKPDWVTRLGDGRATKKIDQLTLESIKELKETFKADAADLLRELHMEHLIHPEEKDFRKATVKTDK